MFRLQKYVTVILIAIYFGIPEVVISNAETLNAAINSSSVLRSDNSTHNKTKGHHFLPSLHPLHLFHSRENKTHSSHGVDVELKALNLSNSTSAASSSLKDAPLNKTLNATRVVRAVDGVKKLNISSNSTLGVKPANATLNTTSSLKPRAIVPAPLKDLAASNSSLKGSQNLTSNATLLKMKPLPLSNLTTKVVGKNSTASKNATVLPRSIDAVALKHNASAKTGNSTTNATSHSRSSFSLFQKHANLTNATLKATSKAAAAGNLTANVTALPKREAAAPSLASNGTRFNSSKQSSNVTGSLTFRDLIAPKVDFTGRIGSLAGNSSADRQSNRTRRQLSEDAERVLPSMFSRPTQSPLPNAPASGPYGYNLPTAAYAQQYYTTTPYPAPVYGQTSSYSAYAPPSYPTMSPPAAAVYGQQSYSASSYAPPSYLPSSTTTAAPAYAQPAYYAVPVGYSSTQAPQVPVYGANTYNTYPSASYPTPAPYSPPARPQPPSQGPYGVRP